jgi:hypothetical protein
MLPSSLGGQMRKGNDLLIFAARAVELRVGASGANAVACEARARSRTIFCTIQTKNIGSLEGLSRMCSASYF